MFNDFSKSHLQILNATNVSILLCDFEGNIFFTSTKFQKLVGHSQRELENISYWDLSEKDSMNQEKQLLKNLSRDTSEVLNHRFVHKNGKSVPVNLVVDNIIVEGQELFSIVIEGIKTPQDYKLELSQAEEKLNRIFSNSRDAIIVLCSKTWAFSKCNGASLELLKADSQNKLIGQTFSDISPIKQPNGRNSRDLIKEKISIALESGRHFFEWQILNLEGNLISCTVLLTKMNDGEDFYLQAVLRDISVQKKLEHKLRDTNEYLSLVLENSGIGIWDLNLSDDSLCLDTKLCEILGIKDDCPERLKDLQSLVHPDDLNNFKKSLMNYLKGDSHVYECVYRVKHREGHYVYIYDKGRFSKWNDRESPTRFTGTFIDISEVKRTEKELKLALEENKVGVWRFNPIENHLVWDDSMYELYGIDKEDFTGDYDAWVTSLRPDYKKIAVQEFTDALAGKSSFNTTFAIVTPSDDTKYIKARAVIDRDSDGAPIYVTGINSDVTKEHNLYLESQKQTELARSAEVAKSEFLANMSHEIRTQMNGIIGIIQLLKDTNLCKDQSELIETMEFSSNSLLRIINDILDLSKIEAGRVVFEVVEFDIISLIKKCTEICKESVEKKGIYLKKSLPDEELSLVKGDAFRINQILLNLLSNAIKFTEKGGVTISLEVSDDENNSSRIEVEVQDTGIGIDEKNIQKLFNNFEQVDYGITKKFGGTGLGLSISSKLAQLMGGLITVESLPNVGSIFKFQINLEKTKNYGRKRTLESKRFENISVEYPNKILVVEDNKINQKVVLRVLKKLGYEADCVDNGKLAIEKIDKGSNSYTLVFMDMEMPVMNGVDTTKYLVEKYKNECPKIIAMTANVLAEDKIKCQEAGMAGFVSKPIQTETIKEVIKKYTIPNGRQIK